MANGYGILIGMTDPVGRLRRAVAARGEAEAEELDATIDALKKGVRQADVARITGKSREHLRKLSIKHGIRDNKK